MIKQNTFIGLIYENIVLTDDSTVKTNELRITDLSPLLFLGKFEACLRELIELKKYW